MTLTKNEINILIFIDKQTYGTGKIIDFELISTVMIAEKSLINSILKNLQDKKYVAHILTKGYKITENGHRITKIVKKNYRFSKI